MFIMYADRTEGNNNLLHYINFMCTTIKKLNNDNILNKVVENYVH